MNQAGRKWKIKDKPELSKAGRASKLRDYLLIAVLAAVSAILFGVGIGWGRTGMVPWAADSIEGVTTVRQLPRLFGEWTTKYPRGQYLINGIFYEPLIKHWQKDPFYQIDRQTGAGRAVVLNMSRYDTLAKISRWISFAVASVFFSDRLTAFLAGLALSFSALFVFYSHLGNVDIPYLFWYTWGLYFAAKSIYVGKWRHFILMSLFFAYSVCTKEAIAGYLAGTGVGYCFVKAGKSLNEGKAWHKAILSVFSLRLVVCALIFLLAYAFIQGLLTSPEVFRERVRVWVEHGVGDFNKSFRGQWPLFLESCRCIYVSVGWPMLVMVIASLIWCCVKYKTVAAFFIFPVITFYFLILVNIKVVCPRYFLPAIVGFSVLVGKTSADFLRRQEKSMFLRAVPLVLVYGLSLLYCVALDLEMLSEPRIRAEKWVAENIDRRTVIACPIRNLSYAPRLHVQGYRFLCPWEVPPLDVMSSGKFSAPPYVILTCYSEEEGQRFRAALEQGIINYRQAARFENRYIWPGRSILGLAGWGECLPWIAKSEPVTIYEKTP
jgi:hypothetical protein